MRRGLDIAYQPGQALSPALVELLERLMGDGSRLPKHGLSHLRKGRDPVPEGLPGTLDMKTTNSTGPGPEFLGGHTHKIDLDSLWSGLAGRVDDKPPVVPQDNKDGDLDGCCPGGDYTPDEQPDTGEWHCGELDPYFPSQQVPVTGGLLGLFWANLDSGAMWNLRELNDGSRVLAPLGPIATDHRDMHTPDARPAPRLWLRVNRDEATYLQSDAVNGGTPLPIYLQVDGTDVVQVDATTAFVNGTLKVGSLNGWLKATDGVVGVAPLPTSLSGSGTTGHLPLWTDTDELGDSLLYESGGQVRLDSAVGAFTAAFKVTADTAYSELLDLSQTGNNAQGVYLNQTGNSAQALQIYNNAGTNCQGVQVYGNGTGYQGLQVYANGNSSTAGYFYAQGTGSAALSARAVDANSYALSTTGGKVKLGTLTGWLKASSGVVSAASLTEADVSGLTTDLAAKAGGSGTGQYLPLWDGSGSSSTLTDSPIDYLSESNYTRARGRFGVWDTGTSDQCFVVVDHFGNPSLVVDHLHDQTWLSQGLTMVGGDLQITGQAGFFGSDPASQPTVLGSRGGNAALASLITGLASLGLLVDGSSA